MVFFLGKGIWKEYSYNNDFVFYNDYFVIFQVDINKSNITK